MSVDYYELLGVPADASGEAITAAYKRLVFALHPDRNPSADATVRTAEINRAFQTLRDPSARAAYDRSRESVSRKDLPWVVIGASKLALYDIVKPKPVHRRMRWEEGIWSQIAERFASCKSRGCLVLIQIDPKTGHQIYKHGDPGPVLEIDPQEGEFNFIPPWIAACHEAEDRPSGPIAL